MKKILAIVAIVMLLQLAIVPATSAAPPAWGGWNDCGDTCYVVQKGDTLFSIGRQFGVNPYHIAWVNRLPNPNCIYEGQVLYIPSGDCCGFGGGMGPRPWPGYGPVMGGMGSGAFMGIGGPRPNNPGIATFRPNPTPPGYSVPPYNPTPPGYNY